MRTGVLRRSVFGVLLFLPLASAPALAQTTGGIEGTVRDESGSPLAGGVVEASGPRGPAGRATATDSGGRFRLLWPPGRDHRIPATLPGFPAGGEEDAGSPGGHPRRRV